MEQGLAQFKMKNICRTCKKEFDTIIPHKRGCSTICIEAYKKKYRRDYYRNKYRNNPNFKKKMLESIKKYAASQNGSKKIKEYEDKHKEFKKLYNRIYQNKENYKRYKRKYMKKYFGTPEGKARKRLYTLKRKRWKDRVIHTFTNEEWISKLYSTNGVCPGCKTPVGIDKLQVDHIIPLSRSHEKQVYTINDVQPLCKSCNLQNRYFQIKFI